MLEDPWHFVKTFIERIAWVALVMALALAVMYVTRGPLKAQSAEMPALYRDTFAMLAP